MRTDRRMMMVRQGLPSAYERLEYIENTSTAYIDTGVKPKYTFDYEIKTNAETGNIVFGCGYTNDYTDYRFFCTQGRKLYFDVGSGGRIISPQAVTTIYHAKFGNYYIQDLDNESNKVTGSTFGENMNNASLSSNLFLLHGYGYIKAKVFLLKINDNDELIRDFIPAKRKSDGTIGMYDLIGRKFYTSPNGVAFSGGVKLAKLVSLFEPVAERRAA